MHIKAYYRRALCFEKMALANSTRTVELLGKSLVDLHAVLAVEKDNKQATSLKKRVNLTLQTIEAAASTATASSPANPDSNSSPEPAGTEGEWEWEVEQCKRRVKVLMENNQYEDAIERLNKCLSVTESSTSGNANPNHTAIHAHPGVQVHDGRCGAGAGVQQRDCCHCHHVH